MSSSAEFQPSASSLSKKASTKAAGVIAVAVACSRVLGLVREVLFANLFGRYAMDIFIAAFRVPNTPRVALGDPPARAVPIEIRSLLRQSLPKTHRSARWAGVEPGRWRHVSAGVDDRTSRNKILANSIDIIVPPVNGRFPQEAAVAHSTPGWHSDLPDTSR